MGLKGWVVHFITELWLEKSLQFSHLRTVSCSASSGTDQIKNRRVQEVQTFQLQIKSITVTQKKCKNITRAQAAIKIKNIKTTNE